MQALGVKTEGWHAVLGVQNTSYRHNALNRPSLFHQSVFSSEVVVDSKSYRPCSLFLMLHDSNWKNSARNGLPLQRQLLPQSASRNSACKELLQGRICNHTTKKSEVKTVLLAIESDACNELQEKPCTPIRCTGSCSKALNQTVYQTTQEAGRPA